MMKKLGFLLLPVLLLFAQYPNKNQLKKEILNLKKSHPELITLEKLTDDIYVVRLALKGKLEPDKRPAIFVGANLEGDRPLATFTALQLIKKVVKEVKTNPTLKQLLTKRTIYVAPLLNPFAYSFYFSKPKREFCKNSTKWDDDRDGLFDEDPPEDLNGDGLITMMRVKDPEGQYIPDPADPRLLKKADPLKGEKGIYKLYVEGLDNDGDGKINEDDIGGVNLQKNFPQEWKPFQNDGGLWPVSEKETRAIVEFFLKHRNIYLAFTYSSFNNLLKLPVQRGPAVAGEMKVRVPKRFARFLNLEPEKEYTINELIKILKGTPFARGMELTPEMVTSFLGVGPSVNINRKDMKIYEKFSKDFKEFLKKKGALTEGEVKTPAGGSLEKWLYFHDGIFAFTSDIWRIPPSKKPKKEDLISRLEKMTPEEFLKLGKDKIEKMLKEMGAPPQMKADMIIQMVRSGRLTPAKIAKFAKMRKKKEKAEGRQADLLAWSDKVLKGKGFVGWKPFKHPTLGEVEIGGFVPFLEKAPPLDKVQKEIEAHNEFVLQLLNYLPEIKIQTVKVEKLDKKIYKLTLYVTNESILPTATEYGARAREVMPILVDLKVEGGKILYGRSKERIRKLDGKSTAKLSWVIMAEKGKKVKIKVYHEKSGVDYKTILLR